MKLQWQNRHRGLHVQLYMDIKRRNFELFTRQIIMSVIREETDEDPRSPALLHVYGCEAYVDHENIGEVAIGSF